MMGQQSLEITHLVGFILFLVIGLLGTFWPRAVQAYELRFYSQINPFLVVSFLEEYVGSETYIWQMRAVGVFCLVAAGVLSYPLLRRPSEALSVIGLQ